MTVLVEASSKSYTGNGVTLSFPTTWRFLDAAHLSVYVDDVLQTETTDYTVSGEGDAEPGGTVTFLTAPANGDSVYIERNTTVTQEVDLRPSGPYLADDIEEMFDRLTLIAQENRRIAQEAAAVASPATISAGSLVFADKTFLTGDEVEDSFPMDVVVASGSTATGCWAVRLRNLDDAAEVFDEPPVVQWAPGVGSNVSLKFCGGLKPNTNYTLRIAAVIP